MSPTPKNHVQELIRVEQLLDAGQFNEALQAVEILDK